MNKIKYQIFISSTYTDLIDEREQVIKACLEMGHIPVGMEMFSASDEEQWQIITRQIDDSDYYILIAANRYGSMVKGLGFTEKEYNYAISKGVPVLGFILDEKAPWPSDRNETDNKARVKLESFKDKIKRKPINFWINKDDLHAKCSIALMKAFNTQPRPGWVRSPDAIAPEIATELSRLSSENANLRTELLELSKEPDISHLGQADDTIELKFHCGTDKGHFILSLVVTWNQIFAAICSGIFSSSRENNISAAITRYFSSLLVEQENLLPQLENYPVYSVRNRYLGDDYIERIRIQFLALGVIKVEYSSGSGTVWELTKKGEGLYISLRAIRRD